MMVVGSVLEKNFDRDFTPDQEKARDHFQTLATGVPKLKTWLGTQGLRQDPLRLF